MHRNVYLSVAMVAVFVPSTVFSQTRSRISLYNPDTVCLALDDFHFIAAKRAVADSLSRARARILVQQRDAIDNLSMQLAQYSKNEKTLLSSIDSCEENFLDAVSANQELQIKTAKLKGWATIGKVGVCLISFSAVVIGITQISR